MNKKIIFSFAFAACLLLSGCSNSFSRQNNAQENNSQNDAQEIKQIRDFVVSNVNQGKQCYQVVISLNGNLSCPQDSAAAVEIINSAKKGDKLVIAELASLFKECKQKSDGFECRY